MKSEVFWGGWGKKATFLKQEELHLKVCFGLLWRRLLASPPPPPPPAPPRPPHPPAAHTPPRSPPANVTSPASSNSSSSSSSSPSLDPIGNIFNDVNNAHLMWATTSINHIWSMIDLIHRHHCMASRQLPGHWLPQNHQFNIFLIICVKELPLPWSDVHNCKLKSAYKSSKVHHIIKKNDPFHLHIFPLYLKMAEYNNIASNSINWDPTRFRKRSHHPSDENDSAS